MEPFNVTGLFSEETYRNGTLYVPAGTKDLYSSTDGWKVSRDAIRCPTRCTTEASTKATP